MKKQDVFSLPWQLAVKLLDTQAKFILLQEDILEDRLADSMFAAGGDKERYETFLKALSKLNGTFENLTKAIWARKSGQIDVEF